MILDQCETYHMSHMPWSRLPKNFKSNGISTIWSKFLPRNFWEGSCFTLVFYLNLARNTLIVEIYGNLWWLHNSKLVYIVARRWDAGVWRWRWPYAMTAYGFGSWLYIAFLFFSNQNFTFFIITLKLRHVIVFLYKKVYVRKIPWTE